MGKVEISNSSESFAYLPKIINGGIAGMVGITCVFPIDLVKTRLQNQRITNDGKIQYKGIVDCAEQTWRHGGRTIFAKIRGIYSGIGVNLLLITPEKAIKLVANDFFRFHLAVPYQEQLPVMRGMIAGGGAGFCQIIVTTPMELLKIQMQDAGRTAGQTEPKKLSAIGLTMDLLKERGIFGLYKGIAPTMARDVSFSVLYFPSFAHLNSLGPRSSDGSGGTVFYASFFAGLVAAAFSSFAITPLDVIKTRMQLISRGEGETEYRNIHDAFMKILRHEGPRALFKGAVCRMLVMAPLFGIAQMVYYIGIAEFILGIPKTSH
ncbi:calcium-binding carrier protein Aralar1 [Loa loa]|uniref:Calcium-binding carrier protein Aralar1 n=1 Tax=Loa loa TaxID=7209 RepID=A0A1I7W1I0_LOALO|nr:calcium-binding carrier protein Aralar1 [Loa loa]EJD74927.1 calcium-binding carrier protein Aralar1 [Loa loa]